MTHEAAERLREYAQAVLDKWELRVACSPQQELANYAIALAAAYLAETDPTPVDEEWLRAVGFEQEHVAHLKIKDDDGVELRIGTYDFRWWLVDDTETEEGCADVVIMAHNQLRTRGEVRRLCAALGIEIKEAT